MMTRRTAEFKMVANMVATLASVSYYIKISTIDTKFRQT